MAGKKEGSPLSFRVEPVLAKMLDEFLVSHRGWSKVEFLSIAAHALLSVPDERKLEALTRYRTWLPKAVEEMKEPAKELVQEPTKTLAKKPTKKPRK